MINKYIILFIFLISISPSYSQTECSGNFEKKYDFDINKYRVYQTNDTIPYTGIIKIPIHNQNLIYFTSYNNGLKDGLEYSVDTLSNIQHRDIFNNNNLVKSTHYFYEQNKIVDSTYVKQVRFSIADGSFLDIIEKSLKSNNPLRLDYTFDNGYEVESTATTQLKQIISIFGNIESVQSKKVKKLYNSYNNTDYYDLVIDISFKNYILNVTFGYLDKKSELKYFSRLFSLDEIKKKSDKNYFNSYIQDFIKENIEDNSLSKYFLKDNKICQLPKISNIFSYQGNYAIIYKLQSECYGKNKIISLKLPLSNVIEGNLNVKHKISVSDYKFEIDGCQYESKE